MKIKGFVTLKQFINNGFDLTSPIGEISAQSLTYSKDVGVYENASYPGYSLLSFSSTDDNSGLPIIVPDDKVTEILAVVSHCISYGVSNIRPFNKQNYINAITASMMGSVSYINIGAFVDNGSTALTEWISWTSTDLSTIKIWLADSSFLSEYDNYAITIVPAVEGSLDVLFGEFNAVVTMLNTITTSVFINTMNTYKASMPESYLRVLTFDLVDSVDYTLTYAVNWGVLVYGIAGDNTDNIKDALVNYILANSQKSETQWAALFPSLFDRTEFFILPRWDKVSIPNLSTQSALYSSVLNAAESVAFAVRNINIYPSNFITSNSTIVPLSYKSIGCVIINGNSNPAPEATIQLVIGDYIPVDTTSSDFARMSLATQNWVTLMEQLIVVAETADTNSYVPMQFRRIVKGGILWISGDLNGVTYQIAAKSNTMYASTT